MENKIVATWDDVPDDIKESVEYGIYTKEEAIKNVNPIVYREPTSNWIWYQEKFPSFYDTFPDDWGECGWKCRFCGVFADKYGYDAEHDYPPEHMKYCPNCGKEMFCK